MYFILFTLGHFVVGESNETWHRPCHPSKAGIICYAHVVINDSFIMWWGTTGNELGKKRLRGLQKTISLRIQLLRYSHCVARLGRCK